jgi:hypothetical protein
LSITATLLAAAMAGCAPPAKTTAPDGSSVDRALAARELPADQLIPGIYRILPADSDLRMLVYRAGPLAHLGHNHVIEARELDGTIELAPEPAQSKLRLRIPVNALVVDDPEARARSGADFAGPIDPEGIAGTRANMLGPQVLAAERWPVIRLEGRLVAGPLASPTLEVDIRIRDRELTRRIPVRIAALPHGKMRVVGGFGVRQTEFGMTPVTALDGALRVSDEVDLVFDLVAARR